MKEHPNKGASVQHFLATKVSPLLSADMTCGGPQKVAVVVRGSQEEIVVDEQGDDASLYSQMGLAKALFYVDQADNVHVLPKKDTALSSLRREAMQSLPT